jgi:hypothetical protein
MSVCVRAFTTQELDIGHIERKMAWIIIISKLHCRHRPNDQKPEHILVIRWIATDMNNELFSSSGP